MMITEGTEAVVSIAGALVGVAALGVTIAFAIPIIANWPYRGRVPQANVETRGFARRSWRWIVVALMPFGFASSCWAQRHTTQVLVVRDGSSAYGKRVLEKRLAAEEPDCPYAPPADDGPVPSSWHPVWVVNESSAPIRIETVQYDQTPNQFEGKRAPTQIIPPGTKSRSGAISNIGPDTPPPDSTISHVPGGIDERLWLTWDE